MRQRQLLQKIAVEKIGQNRDYVSFFGALSKLTTTFFNPSGNKTLEITYFYFAGAALVAAAASSAAVAAVAAASNPVGAAVAVPVLGLGSTAVLSSASSSTSFWDRFSTWPIFQLSGITDVWPFILTVFLIYVGIIIITDGDMLFNAIQGSLSFGQSKWPVTYDLTLMFSCANLPELSLGNYYHRIFYPLLFSSQNYSGWKIYYKG